MKPPFPPRMREGEREQISQVLHRCAEEVFVYLSQTPWARLVTEMHCGVQVNELFSLKFGVLLA